MFSRYEKGSEIKEESRLMYVRVVVPFSTEKWIMVSVSDFGLLIFKIPFV